MWKGLKAFLSRLRQWAVQLPQVATSKVDGSLCERKAYCTILRRSYIEWVQNQLIWGIDDEKYMQCHLYLSNGNHHGLEE